MLHFKRQHGNGNNEKYLRVCVLSTIHYNDIDLLRGESSEATAVSFGGHDGVLIYDESAGMYLAMSFRKE